MGKRLLKQKRKEDILLMARELDMELLAVQTGFYKVSPKKITASSMFLSLWRMQHLGKNTLRNWAIQIGQHRGQTVSKQSLNERLNEKSVELAKSVLRKVLNNRINPLQLNKQPNQLSKRLSPFNRVLIRDSTTQQLPSGLHEVFRGSYSHGKPTAIMRIQALFNYTEQKWEDFQLGAYTDNDQSAAGCVAAFLQPGDLLLQDLGYFTLDWIRQLTEQQYLITKWDHQTALFNEQGLRIDLLSLIRGKKQIDQPVFLGSRHRIPLRLIVRKLPEARARKRIEKARRNRHSKANHSEQYFEWLKYEIYLTNVKAAILKPKAIAKLYGLRWHIEILFKSWKSYANFRKMFADKPMKLHRVLFTIYAVLIQFVWLSGVCRVIQRGIDRFKNGEYLSPLKFLDMVNDFIQSVLYIRQWTDLNQLIRQFAVHATYRKHPKRQNTNQKYLYVNELCITKLQT